MVNVMLEISTKSDIVIYIYIYVYKCNYFCISVDSVVIYTYGVG